MTSNHQRSSNNLFIKNLLKFILHLYIDSWKFMKDRSSHLGLFTNWFSIIFLFLFATLILTFAEDQWQFPPYPYSLFLILHFLISIFKVPTSCPEFIFPFCSATTYEFLIFVFSILLLDFFLICLLTFGQDTFLIFII